jgi:outer membrane translocation and assembly module TamA
MTSLLLTALLALAAVPAFATCDSHDFRKDKNGGIVVDTIVLNEDRTLTSADLSTVRAHFSGACFDDNSQAIGDRIRFQFQQLGYYRAEVNNVHIKVLDPLAKPKRVNIEADVNAGPLERLREINFVGNHALSAEQLRASFPLKPGDTFHVGKIGSGLEAVRKMYGAAGYADITPIPDTLIGDDGGVTLRIEVDEGKQYHMGTLDVVGSSRAAGILKTRWQLQPGEVWNNSYWSKFLDDNAAVLPDDFSRETSVEIARDCPDGVMNVRLIVDRGPKLAPLKTKDCDAAKETAKQQ